MGREIRRVPLDFDWPINKTWEGFLNPHGGPCPGKAAGTCFHGSTAGRAYVSAIAQLLAVAGGDAANPTRNGIIPHPYIADLPMVPRHPEYGPAVVPSPDLAELTKGLAGRGADRPFGHDAIDRRSIEKKIIEAAGLDDKWGICPICDGEGDDPAQREAAEAWKETPPPTGDAYQLWETTSEGSPISPPKATPEALARWLADNGASTFGSETASYETWLKFIRGPGWSVSAVFGGGRGLRSGVDAATEEQTDGQ